MLGTLREEMDHLATMSVADTQKNEASFQKLYMLLPDDSIVVAALDVGPGRQIAYVARKLVYENEPAIAVLETEGWTVRWDIPRSDPIWGRVARGEIAPSDLPPDKRGESLIMYGESSDGEVITRLWKILPDGDGKRRVEPLDEPDLKFSTRFTPLFIVEDLERLVDGELSLGEVNSRQYKSRTPSERLLDKEMVSMMRQVVADLPRAERHQILRKVVGETFFADEPFKEVTRRDTYKDRQN